MSYLIITGFLLELAPAEAGAGMTKGARMKGRNAGMTKEDLPC